EIFLHQPQFAVARWGEQQGIEQLGEAVHGDLSRRQRGRAIPRARKLVRGVMIHHLSIAARDPKRAAGVLAELMGGKAVPFPPNPGSFFALQLDEHGSGVEVYPAGTELEPNGNTGGSFVKQTRERRYGSTHFALHL